MAKSFDITKKSDMRKFEKELKKSIMDSAKSSLMKQSYDVECPKCHQTFPAHAGLNVCPFCKKEIDLQLDFNF